ncbi:MAG TPA: hypothetical protein VL738_10035 [Dactylosporangium sp.]|nr:hypothetical protein [Dactylosporangium sp.]
MPVLRYEEPQRVSPDERGRQPKFLVLQHEDRRIIAPMNPEPPEGSRARRDREAAEHVLGRPLSRQWPAGALPAGTRVRVVKDAEWDGPWRAEFLGVIDTVGAPEPVVHAMARPGELKYWVSFDTPQLDAAGDGPYRAAQIWDRHLRPVPPDSAGVAAGPAG